ncbi:MULTISPECIES: helix-turn-helix domain-containing protein [unclassified Roseateles]|uniref:helix-turn-helix domain-containing protein n=1 Tax=unclassified Roseateles TaxID=2626991 RepID=UPI0006F8C0B4|nr:MULTISPECIES: XRE family transcriptional regulator [unclassified Roseateles]KQW46462.1 DNA-binding protein [Pelomonas sp. Root405]KRA73512.1 DNA-binding protein [Pelomonas sp. Root662]
MDITQRIGRRLHELRSAAGLSLDALAHKSGVSRSNISLIERGQSSPTAVVLDKLSSALGVSVASMFEGAAEASPSAAPSPLVRVADQPVWDDPASGYRRRNVSPAGMSPLQLVDVIFPAGQRVAFETSARDADIHQLVWMIDGVMEIGHGGEQWQLNAGDCLAMQLDAPIRFHNPGTKPARYLVALTGARP